MKKVIFSLALLGLSMQTFAQNVLYEAKIKQEAVPEVVTESIEEDFPDYTITEVSAIPIEYIDEDVIIDKNISSNDSYNTYQIKLEGKGQNIETTYDKEGNLKMASENLKDVLPPVAIRTMIAKKFPGWMITKDNYKMTNYHGKEVKERYKLILKKGKDKMKVYADTNGTILKVS